MQNWIKRLLAPPTFPGDAEKTRIASLLNVILLALTAIFIVNTAVAFLFNPSPAAFWLNAGTIGLTIGLLVILRRGHVRVASLLTLSVFWVAVAGLAFFLTGLSLTIVTSFFVLIVLASALTSQRTMVVFVLLTLVAVGIAAYLRSPPGNTPTNRQLPRQHHLRGRQPGSDGRCPIPYQYRTSASAAGPAGEEPGIGRSASQPGSAYR